MDSTLSKQLVSSLYAGTPFHYQRIEVSLSPPAAAQPASADVILSRAQRAHSRLSWQARLARNARPATAGPVTIKLFGIPAPFAASLGLATA